MAVKKEPEITKAAKTAKPETVKFEVTLGSGQVLKLEALADQNDYPIEAGIRAQRGETMAFLDLVLTPGSRYRLHSSTARMSDFESIARVMGEAVGAVEEGDED